MQHLFATLCLLIFCSCSAQAQSLPPFNLDFEELPSADALPTNWFVWGDYDITTTSEKTQSGQHCIRITADDDGTSFGSLAYRIPDQYEGEKITLEGYIKTQDVVDGFAGLLLRIDGESGSLAFDNMESRQIKGTRDWEKHSITLAYPKGGKTIIVGSILVGKGQAWFDHFTLSIDGQDIQSIPIEEKPALAVTLDREFDKGSQFALTDLNEEQQQRLYKLGKLWGFLKYYHPAIANGTVNWDYELFRILPKLDSPDFDQALLQWAQAISKETELIKREIDPSQPAPDIRIHPDLKWLGDRALFTDELQALLYDIKEAERPEEHYYVSLNPQVGNPDFSNENPYPDMAWEDTGYRLLALFRYWNMIEYFFPYKELIETDWDDVLWDYLPRLVESPDELSYKLSLLSLIGEIHDTHANLWMQDSLLRHFYGENIAPLDIQFVEDQPVIVKRFSQLKNEAIAVGDVITHIDGQPVVEVIAEEIQYCPASNYPTQLRDVARRLLRTNAATVKVTLQDGSLTKTVEIATVPTRNINFWASEQVSNQELDGNIGYIYPGTLKAGEIHSIMKRFMNKNGLIIDLRCYPSDFIVFSLGKYLMPEPTDFVQFTKGDLQSPGTFAYKYMLKVGAENVTPFAGKVVILINEKTQSQAEYTTMALRVAPQAMVIGSTTAGADGNVSEIYLPGNVRTMISGIGVYYPDGTDTQRIGIVPDLEVKPTIAGIRAGRDEVLERAIKLINE